MVKTRWRVGRPRARERVPLERACRWCRVELSSEQDVRSRCVWAVWSLEGGRLTPSETISTTSSCSRSLCPASCLAQSRPGYSRLCLLPLDKPHHRVLVQRAAVEPTLPPPSPLSSSADPLSSSLLSSRAKSSPRLAMSSMRKAVDGATKPKRAAPKAKVRARPPSLACRSRPVVVRRRHDAAGRAPGFRLGDAADEIAASNTTAPSTDQESTVADPPPPPPLVRLARPQYIDPLVQATFQQDGQLQEVVRTLASRMRDPNTTVRPPSPSLLSVSLLPRPAQPDP